MAENDFAVPDRPVAEDRPPDVHKMDVLKFIFSAHLELFNTRREHEWRVIISALVLIGAVDVTMLSQHMKLTDRQEDFWWFALLVLLLSIGWYQWGVQKRNRADRIAMDRVLHVLCDDIKVAPDSCIRAGVDREDPRVLTTQSDIIFHFTYLWAFLAQMSVLIVATALSMYLPVLIKELATSAGSPPAAQVFGMISDKLVGLAR